MFDLFVQKVHVSFIFLLESYDVSCLPSNHIPEHIYKLFVIKKVVILLQFMELQVVCMYQNHFMQISVLFFSKINKLMHYFKHVFSMSEFGCCLV